MAAALAGGGLVALLALPGWPAAALELPVFVREGCPHCADADQFLARLSSARRR